MNKRDIKKLKVGSIIKDNDGTYEVFNIHEFGVHCINVIVKEDNMIRISNIHSQYYADFEELEDKQYILIKG